MSTPRLGIIDYGAGNLHSVRNTFLAAGYESILVTSPADLEGLTHLVLPGVGEFGDCATKLRTQGLEQSVRDWIEADKPFLGICVGYQILFDSGDESPGVPGLGILCGHVRKFPEGDLKVPHMGWNSLTLLHPEDPVWQGMEGAPHFYFVHSYYPVPENDEWTAATCTYGGAFAAAVRRGNLVATQFHPEKSQKLGIRFLANFLTLR